MQFTNPIHSQTTSLSNGFPLITRKWVIGALLFMALFAFEIFNFDTTKYALSDLLGPVKFLNFEWATILAIAFCSIDVAGLSRILSNDANDRHSNIYLGAAWFLGATLNAVMTWWAVSLTLLEHSFGNEVLSREQLLMVVPFFVAVLVLLTRVLFIGAMSASSQSLLKAEKAAESRLEKATLRPKAPTVRRTVYLEEPIEEPISFTRKEPTPARQPIARQPMPKAKAKPAPFIPPKARQAPMNRPRR